MQRRAADAITPLQAAAQGLRDAESDTLLAIALRQTGRSEDALARLKRATKRRPPYAPAFHELGGVLTSLERYHEAIEALRRGLEIAPMMPQLRVQLGQVFLQRRDYADAKTAFAGALQIAPNSADALFGIATQRRDSSRQGASAWRRGIGAGKCRVRARARRAR
jgi:tetratricopeptide (TPR) repeat protein